MNKEKNLYEVYLEGRQAYSDGKSWNPYSYFIDEDKHLAWNDGWFDANGDE